MLAFRKFASATRGTGFRNLCTASHNVDIKQTGKVSSIILGNNTFPKKLFSINEKESIGDLSALIQKEYGPETNVVISRDDVNIAHGTMFKNLLHSDFSIKLDDTEFCIRPDDTVRHLHSTLDSIHTDLANISKIINPELIYKHEVEKEKLEEELAPLQTKIEKSKKAAEKYTNNLMWAGLGLMGIQWGFLARLTWWEFSWDLMEPVTYFITTGNAMFFYALFATTKQDYDYTTGRSRAQIARLQRFAKKEGVDLDEYVRLKQTIAQHEKEMKRLKQ